MMTELLDLISIILAYFVDMRWSHGFLLIWFIYLMSLTAIHLERVPKSEVFKTQVRNLGLGSFVMNWVENLAFEILGFEPGSSTWLLKPT